MWARYSYKRYLIKSFRNLILLLISGRISDHRLVCVYLYLYYLFTPALAVFLYIYFATCLQLLNHHSIFMCLICLLSTLCSYLSITGFHYAYTLTTLLHNLSTLQLIHISVLYACLPQYLFHILFLYFNFCTIFTLIVEIKQGHQVLLYQLYVYFYLVNS